MGLFRIITSGWWFVSTVKVLPKIKSWNLQLAKTTASSYFSICV